MEAMAALIDAGLSGLRSTPSPGDAHLSGEPAGNQDQPAKRFQIPLVPAGA
jgi:hypothetical protein